MKFVIILALACCVTMCYAQRINPRFQVVNGDRFQQRAGQPRVFIFPFNSDDLRTNQGSSRPSFRPSRPRNPTFDIGSSFRPSQPRTPTFDIADDSDNQFIPSNRPELRPFLQDEDDFDSAEDDNVFQF